jgi:hypothetical protein
MRPLRGLAQTGEGAKVGSPWGCDGVLLCYKFGYKQHLNASFFKESFYALATGSLNLLLKSGNLNSFLF